MLRSQRQKRQKSLKKLHGRWILNPGVASSKPPSGSKVDSAFHLSKVDQMNTKTPGDWVVKSKKSPL